MSRHIRPRSTTIGCMIEAIVNNGDTEGAYELIHQMQDDEQCCEALNSVIYCSVLKGFAREKKLERGAARSSRRRFSTPRRRTTTSAPLDLPAASPPSTTRWTSCSSRRT